MKLFFKVWIVIGLVSIIGLPACSTNQATTDGTSVQSRGADGAITVRIPRQATVELLAKGDKKEDRKEDRKTGRLTDLNEQKLTLTLSGQAIPIDIKDIKGVKFQQEASLPQARDLTIRGEAEVWRVEPLTALKIKDASSGQAQILPGTFTKENKVAYPTGKPSSYQLKEMQFDPNFPNTMRLIVAGAN